MATEMQRADHDREHFDGIAASYAGKDLVPSARCARRLRLEHLIARVPIRPNWKVLEVGCGAGFAASYLQGRFGSYTGVDHSTELIKVARERNSGPGVTFTSTSISDFDDGSDFDLAFMVGVLHHLDNRPKIMSRIRELLRPGGFFAVNEPQPANPLVSLARKIRASVDRSYSDDQDQIAYDEIHTLFTDGGFTEIEIFPQGLFSTPFAEVPVRPDWLAVPCARAACRLDAFVDARLAGLVKSLTWNLSAVGRRPLVPRPEDGVERCPQT
jgi:SAM-dependent methyltransferase